ncbi:unnamed protein product [marine sediment metagenome]|uniref:Uncharacterized protein n=1 Tax=marine sediment metagenome TaxID=412755 RepID=X1AFH3_9ZZZZ
MKIFKVFVDMWRDGLVGKYSVFLAFFIPTVVIILIIYVMYFR